ncbi:Gfo/Idh/MocA family protein [Streptomyces sp. NPDC048001]|uniref:Gfo/Idh/MocA family protein n=1 Tax=Streptomyces sp. NPDC048001 TaxID=3365498 RepID=UPI0037234752
MDTLLRIGLVGTGPWAGATQAPALAGHPGVAFSGVWGRRPEAAALLADAHRTAAFTGEDGLSALFASSDAVAFSVPPDVQAPLAARAAEAGCHLLLDKPVATSVEGARAVARAAEEAAVASVVFCTLRFAAPTAGWIAAQREAGGWFTAHGHWLGSLHVPGSESPFAASAWRREKGGLWDVGPHLLSVLLPVLGDVTGLSGGRGPAGTAHLVLRHAGGASSTVTVGLGAPERAAGAGLVLLGEHGRAELPEAWGDPVDSFRSAVDALRRAAREGRPHPCDVRFGLRITELLAQAEAALSG